jgi:hypothetical protein
MIECAVGSQRFNRSCVIIWDSCSKERLVYRGSPLFISEWPQYFTLDVDMLDMSFLPQRYEPPRSMEASSDATRVSEI